MRRQDTVDTSYVLDQSDGTCTEADLVQTSESVHVKHVAVVAKFKQIDLRPKVPSS